MSGDKELSFLGFFFVVFLILQNSPLFVCFEEYYL